MSVVNGTTMKDGNQFDSFTCPSNLRALPDTKGLLAKMQASFSRYLKHIKKLIIPKQIELQFRFTKTLKGQRYKKAYKMWTVHFTRANAVQQIF